MKSSAGYLIPRTSVEDLIRQDVVISHGNVAFSRNGFIRFDNLSLCYFFYIWFSQVMTPAHGTLLHVMFYIMLQYLTIHTDLIKKRYDNVSI